MNELAILEGTSAIEIVSVINLQDIHQFLDSKLEIYKNYMVTEESQESDKKVLEELKGLRKPVKDLRAKLNKELKAKTDIELKKIDEITAKLDGVIKPIEDGIEQFAEERRQERINRKNQKFDPVLADINNTIKASEIPYLILNEIAMKDDWYRFSDEKIVECIDNEVKAINNQIKDAKNRIDLIKIYAESIKEQYLLKADIDIYFKGELYTRDIDEIKTMIEEKAAEQCKVETEVKEVLKQEELIIEEMKKAVIVPASENNYTKDNFTLQITNCTRDKTKALKAWLVENNIEFKIENRG